MSASVRARQPASPYARRLARESGVALELIAGTGPGGRIVAADVEAFTQKRATAPQVVAAPMQAVSGYSTTVKLEQLQSLLAGLGQSGTPVTLDDMLVRAGALALEALPEAGTTLALETGGGRSAGLAVVTDAHLGLVSRLHQSLADAREAPAGTAPVLTLRRLAQRDIRPTAMPLLPGTSLRLTISAADDDITAEVLLSFDAASVGEEDAASFLARFRDGLETPLRLLA